ncbi:T9SS type A sorting domain-containing protein [bacterium]|nr:T9SS type A sorting domain-containing protein [bacterium]
MVKQYYSNWDYASDIAVSGEFAFVTTLRTGLSVLDIRDRHNPVEVARCRTVGRAGNITIQGELAYIGDSRDGWLSVIDISSPQNPLEIGQFQFDEPITDVVIEGDFAFLACRQSGLIVVDVSNPTDPTIVDIYDTPGNVSKIAIAGNCAFVTDSDSVRIISISDVMNMEELAAFPAIPSDVHVDNGIAYVSDWSGGMHIIDVSEPANPVEMSYFITPPNATSVSVSGNLVYLTLDNTDVDLVIIDVTDPYNALQLEGLVTTNRTENVAIVDNFSFLAEGYAGIQVFDVTEPTDPLPVGAYDPWGRLTRIEKRDSLLFIGGVKDTDNTGVLRILNIGDPDHPVELGECNLPGSPKEIVISNSYLYIANDHSGLSVINIEDLLNPQLMASLGTAHRAYDVSIFEGCAYVADFVGGLRIIDILDPSNPSEVTSIETIQSTNAVEVLDNMAYLTDEDIGLIVFDINDPEHPLEMDRYTSPQSATDVAISNGFAYVASGNHLYIVDISDPENLSEISIFDNSGEIDGVTISNGFAYLTEKDEGYLYILDVQDPANPVEAGYYNTPGEAWDLVVSDQIVFVADNNYLDVLDCTEAIEWTGVYDQWSSLPLEAIVQQAYPNPSNSTITIPFDTFNPTQLEIAIFNVLGLQVFSAIQGYGTGHHRFVLDCNQPGLNLVSGTYFLKFKMKESTFTRKITLLK